MIDPNSAVYDDDGRRICDGCDGDLVVEAAFDNSLKGYASAALGFGILAVCFNLFFIPSILSLLAGIPGLIAAFGGNRDFKAAGERNVIFLVMLLIGVGLSTLRLMFDLGLLLLVGVGVIGDRGGLF